MTLGERDAGTRSRKRGGAIVLAVVLLGAFAIGAFVWMTGGDDAQLPTKEQVARPGGTKYLVTAEPVRTSRGFEVIPLTAEDFAAQPVLEDLVTSGGRATLILTGPQLDALTAHLVTRLPPGWDDPYDYGVVWQHGNGVVHLGTSQADVL